MHLKNLLIEHRPSLRCANFFVELSDLISPHELSIEIKQNAAPGVTSFNEIILLNSINLDVSNHFNVNSNSVSCLTIDGEKLSFRVATTEHLKNFSTNNTTSKNLLESKFLELNVQENVDCRIECRNCKNYLSNNLNFKRIRELPSENMDMGEWFCHKHSHNGGPELPEHFQQSGLNSTKFSPDHSDLFYGLFYILLNNTVLNDSQSVATLSTAMKCSKCMISFGEMMSNNKTIKIWNDDILISNETCFKISTHLEMFQYLIKNCIRDATCNYHVPLPMILKIVFMTKNGETHLYDYLVIQIMNCDTEFFKGVSTGNSNTIGIASTNILKIMYHCTQSDDEFKNNPIYHTVDISNFLFKFILNYFECNSQCFPEIFRKCHNFVISFIELN